MSSHKGSYIHIFTFQGLVVPVLRNVETMSFADIEKELNSLATKVQYIILYEEFHCVFLVRQLLTLAIYSINNIVNNAW